MMYLVIYYEDYVGYHFDGMEKLFVDKKAAEVYRDVLNIDIANTNFCKVKDLGDYYKIVEIPIAK